MVSSAEFLAPVETRRSIYPLSNSSPISDDRIVEIVRTAILHVPSSFNSQSTRAVVLLKKEHEKLWDITKECLKPQMPEEQFQQTSKKLDGFRAGYGTVLFFEDPEPVKALQSRFAIYADKFPQWSEHTSGMHQYVVWTALEADGLGCNLQHYNPVIDQRVQNEWKVPMEWGLKAQLVFGKRAGEPGKKEFKPVEERLFVHGK
ncbi:Nitroreductase-like [Lasallia pustulata]|nr:Nitroreductase-like [Lasallia pustulata]